MKDASTANDLLKNSSLYREFQPSARDSTAQVDESEKPGMTSASSGIDGLDHQSRSSWRKTRQVAGPENRLNVL